MSSIRLSVLLQSLIILISCNAPAQKSGYRLVEPFPKITISDPIELTSPEDGTNRIFVVSQKGSIHLVVGTGDNAKAPMFLDIKSHLESGGEKGLLGLAFHPNYKTNGFFYLNYTRATRWRSRWSR